MEKPEADSPATVYFVFHGGCPDGFFTCLVFDLWRLALGNKDIREAVRSAFKRSDKLTMDEPEAISGHDGVKDFTGKMDRAPCWTEEGNSYGDVVYRKIMYTSVPSNVKDIIKTENPKDVMIMADVGSLEVFKSLKDHFAEIYFVDHHQSALDDGLCNKEFLDSCTNATFHYDTKVSACRMMLNILLRHGGGHLQEYFSPLFGENLVKMVNTVSLGDVNSVLNLPVIDRQYKAGFCSLSDIMSFSKNYLPVHLRKIANYDFDVIVKIGKKCVEDMEKSIEPELKHAEIGHATYQSVSQGKEVTMIFLMLKSTSKYRSDLGNYLSQMSSEEGFDPISLVYAPHTGTGKQGYYKGSWRALDLPSHPNINLTEFCSLYNGGGHKHASGCELSESNVSKFRVKTKRTPSQFKSAIAIDIGSKTDSKIEQADNDSK